MLHLDADVNADVWFSSQVPLDLLSWGLFRLRDWLMEQKVAKLNKDGNKAAKGGNWPVFDFCNQFLQV